jgi:hypothetical protein
MRDRVWSEAIRERFARRRAERELDDQRDAAEQIEADADPTGVARARLGAARAARERSRRDVAVQRLRDEAARRLHGLRDGFAAAIAELYRENERQLAVSAYVKADPVALRAERAAAAALAVERWHQHAVTAIDNLERRLAPLVPGDRPPGLGIAPREVLFGTVAIDERLATIPTDGPDAPPRRVEPDAPPLSNRERAMLDNIGAAGVADAARPDRQLTVPRDVWSELGRGWRSY